MLLVLLCDVSLSLFSILGTCKSKSYRLSLALGCRAPDEIEKGKLTLPFTFHRIVRISAVVSNDYHFPGGKFAHWRGA